MALSRGERYWNVIRLGTPIVGGMISQNVLNLVDTAMVGTLGNAALAGVGTASFLNFMSVAFLTGFSVGVQAMVARRIGEGRESVAALPLNGTLVIILGLALPWTVLLFLLAPTLFPLVNDSAEVVSIGVPYWQARLVGVAAIGLNFSFRGFWNGIKRPGFYLRTLLVMHATNIVLNYVLIFGKFGFPAYGATGAGIASAVSVYVGLLTYIYLGFRHAQPLGFLQRLPDRDTVMTTLRLAIPSGIQQLLFSASFTTLFAILGMISTTATAAANVVLNVMLVAVLPGIAFGIASATLVGQALGRKDPDEAERSAWDVVTVAAIVMTVIGLPMILFPDVILEIFIHDPETIQTARVPLQIVGATIGIDAVGMVLMNSLMGAGATRTSMFVQVTMQWGLLLPFSYIMGPVLGFGLVGVWAVQAGVRMIQAITYTIIWRQRRWATIQV
ncbi:MAG: MATE family efflux transporter [Myxococcota bacterium]